MANTSLDFTTEAQNILNLAIKEAQRLKHKFIDAEHILLALVADEDGIVAKALSNAGLKPSKLRCAVEFVVGHGERVREDEIRLTPRAKRVIELAQEDARRLNYGYCGSEHLFLAILREGEGVAAEIIGTLVGSAGLDAVCTEIILHSDKCPTCGADTRKVTIDYPVFLKGKVMIVRGVPGLMCSQCSDLFEIDFAPELQEKVRHMIESDAVPHREAKVPVYELADMC